MTAPAPHLSTPFPRVSASAAAAGPDWAGRAVLGLAFLAAVAMLSLPQARTASPAFGWMPLWLAGLPATAWLALALARSRGR